MPPVLEVASSLPAVGTVLMKGTVLFAPALPLTLGAPFNSPPSYLQVGVIPSGPMKVKAPPPLPPNVIANAGVALVGLADAGTQC